MSRRRRVLSGHIQIISPGIVWIRRVHERPVESARRERISRQMRRVKRRAGRREGR